MYYPSRVTHISNLLKPGDAWEGDRDRDELKEAGMLGCEAGWVLAERDEKKVWLVEAKLDLGKFLRSFKFKS